MNDENKISKDLRLQEIKAKLKFCINYSNLYKNEKLNFNNCICGEIADLSGIQFKHNLFEEKK